MKGLKIDYLELTEPDKFYKDWNEERFISWITRKGVSLLYLQTVLANLESKEMYEFCTIVKEIIHVQYENH